MPVPSDSDAGRRSLVDENVATAASAASASDGAWVATEVLGRGAVATVYRITAPDGESFAGKVLHASHEHDAAAARRFDQEARLVSSFSHPNLVGAHGVRKLRLPDGSEGHALILDLVEGLSLRERIARSAPLEETQLLAIAGGIAAGLAAAHRAGVIHRDLKPANILLDENDHERPRIADFGLARASSLAGGQGTRSALVGTPDYMAPESMDALAVDARSDLYALGCIIYEMAMGQPPYAGATSFAVLDAHRSAAVPELEGPWDPRLVELCRALLAKSPSERPQSAEAVVATVDAIADGPSRALATVERIAGSRCTRCAEPLVEGLSICLACGTQTLHLAAGDHCLVVVGPGDVGDKLEAGLRDGLVAWLDARPELGIKASKRLAGRIPRVPFVLVKSIDAKSAERLVGALQSLGLKCQAHRGGGLSHADVRKKGRTMAGRVAAIFATSMAGVWQHGWGALGAIIGMVVASTATFVASGRSVASLEARHRAALPVEIQPALVRAETAVGALREPRHRDGLRAVVARAVDLTRDPRLGADAAMREELAHAVDVATAAVLRLDALDGELAAKGATTSGDAEDRVLLHERDTWAARLLELTARLETLRVRLATVGAEGGGEGDRELVALRAKIEALEEVQSS